MDHPAMKKTQLLRQWVLSIPDEVSNFAPAPTFKPTPITSPRPQASHKRSRSVTELPLFKEKESSKRRMSLVKPRERDIVRDTEEPDKHPPPIPQRLESTIVSRWRPLASRCFDSRRLSFPSCMRDMQAEDAAARAQRRRVSFASIPVVIQRSPSISSLPASSSFTHSIQDTYESFKSQHEHSDSCGDSDQKWGIPFDSSSSTVPERIVNTPALGTRKQTPFYSTPNIPLGTIRTTDDDAVSVSSYSSDDSWKTAVEEPQELEDLEPVVEVQHAVRTLFTSVRQPAGGIRAVEQVRARRTEKTSDSESSAYSSTASPSNSASVYSVDDPVPISNYSEQLRRSIDIVEYHESTTQLCQHVEEVLGRDINEDTRHYKDLSETVVSEHFCDQDSYQSSTTTSSSGCSIDQAETRAHIWPRIGLHDVADLNPLSKDQTGRQATQPIPSATELRAARRLAPTDADSIRSYGKSNRIKTRFTWFRLNPKSSQSSREDLVFDDRKPTLPEVAENWPLP